MALKLPLYGGAAGAGMPSLKEGLVAAWLLQDASPADSWGQHTLTPSGGPTGAEGPGGQLPRSTQFNPANSQYFLLPDTADLRGADITFCLCAWARRDGAPGADVRIAGKYLTTGNQREYSLFDQQSTKRHAFIVSANGTVTGGNRTIVVASSTVSNEVWELVWAMHDAEANVIGVAVNDGDFATAAHSAGVFGGSGDFAIGAGSNPHQFYNGRIAGVHFWRGRIPDAQERAFMYNGGTPRAYPFKEAA